MIANDVINILKQWNFESGQRLGDGTDVISSTFTFAITMCLAAVMAVRTYILSPIECHAPVSFGGENFNNYVNNYCFIEGSVALAKSTVSTYFPQTAEEWETAKKDGRVGYYPWIPLYLSVMALLPFIISTMWKLLYSRRIGTDLQGLLEMALKAQLQDGEERRKTVERIASLIAETLWKNREYRSGRLSKLKNKMFETMGFGFFSKRFGSWLNFWYFIVKLAYLMSHVIGLIMMHKFLSLDKEHRLFGFQVFMNIMKGQYWDETMVFPRVTWCRVPIKHNQISYNIVQCVLPGNLFSEIIFAILWIWHAFAIFPMAISLMKFIVNSFSSQNKQHFIRKCLILSGELDDERPGLRGKIHFFHRRFLKQDGHLTLRMFETAVGTAVTCDIVAALWRIYVDKEERNQLPEICSRENIEGEKAPLVNIDRSANGVGFGQESIA